MGPLLCLLSRPGGQEPLFWGWQPAACSPRGWEFPWPIFPHPWAGSDGSSEARSWAQASVLCQAGPARPRGTDWPWGGQIVQRAAGGSAARRSAQRVRMVLTVSPRREPAGAAPAMPAAAASTVSVAPPQPSPWARPPWLNLPPRRVPRGLVRAWLPHEVLLCQRRALPPGDRTLQLCPWVDRPQLPER